MTEVTVIVRAAKPYDFQTLMTLGPYLLLIWSFVDAVRGIRLTR